MIDSNYFEYTPEIKYLMTMNKILIEHFNAYNKMKYQDMYIEEYDFQEISKNQTMLNIVKELRNSSFNVYDNIRKYDLFIFFVSKIGRAYFTEILGEELVKDINKEFTTAVKIKKSQSLDSIFYNRYLKNEYEH